MGAFGQSAVAWWCSQRVTEASRSARAPTTSCGSRTSSLASSPSWTAAPVAELAKYYSVVPTTPATRLDRMNVGKWMPDHIVVDYFGDAWVGNKAIRNQGSVTKIASRLEDCVDRNGDGVITTSSDKSGDGMVVDDELIIPTSPNDLNEYDECVLFTTVVGPPVPPDAGDDSPYAVTALAVAPGPEFSAGEVWAGLDYFSTFYKLNAEFGTPLVISPDGGHRAGAPTGLHSRRVPRSRRPK